MLLQCIDSCRATTSRTPKGKRQGATPAPTCSLAASCGCTAGEERRKDRQPTAGGQGEGGRGRWAGRCKAGVALQASAATCCTSARSADARQAGAVSTTTQPTHTAAHPACRAASQRRTGPQVLPRAAAPAHPVPRPRQHTPAGCGRACKQRLRCNALLFVSSQREASKSAAAALTTSCPAAQHASRAGCWHWPVRHPTWLAVVAANRCSSACRCDRSTKKEKGMAALRRRVEMTLLPSWVRLCMALLAGPRHLPCMWNDWMPPDNLQAKRRQPQHPAARPAAAVRPCCAAHP